MLPVKQSIPIYKPFREQYTLDQRIQESRRLKLKYPEKVPVVCESKSTEIQQIVPNRLLVDKYISIGHLIYTIRKRINLDPRQAIFVFVNDSSVPPSGFSVAHIFDLHKSVDGFLYISYSTENTFGSFK